MSILKSSVVIAQITAASCAGVRFSNTFEKMICAMNSSFSDLICEVVIPCVVG